MKKVHYMSNCFRWKYWFSPKSIFRVEREGEIQIILLLRRHCVDVCRTVGLRFLHSKNISLGTWTWVIPKWIISSFPTTASRTLLGAWEIHAVGNIWCQFNWILPPSFVVEYFHGTFRVRNENNSSHVPYWWRSSGTTKWNDCEIYVNTRYHLKVFGRNCHLARISMWLVVIEHGSIVRNACACLWWAPSPTKKWFNVLIVPPISVHTMKFW